jgi:chondroitin AC lyase
MSRAHLTCYLTFVLILLISMTFVRGQSDLMVVRDRVALALLQTTVDDREVTSLLESIREDGTWPGIDYKDVSRTGFEHRLHLSHLLTLARAYQQNSSGFFQNKQVKRTIERALQHWVDNDYQCDNWWYNQIGVPNGLVSLLLLVGEELDPSLVMKTQPIIGRAHIDAPGARPGGDRIKIAGIEAKNLLFLGEGEKFAAIIKVIEAEIKFSEWVGATYGYGFRNIPSGFANRQMGGRGIMHDYSFHHRTDGVNNTLSYGLGYAAAFAEWAVYTAGTRFAFSDEKLEALIDYFLDGICKTAVFGKYPDPGVKNRSISRPGALRPYGADLAEKLLLTSDYRKAELAEIIAIRDEGAKPSLSHATWFWHTEHFSLQRPDWFASVRMYSTRTHNMEQPYNSEGLLNHHRGDGANHLSRTGDEYLDLWPVYDYQKIPGATIMQKAELPGPEEIQKLGLTDFVGAATDGTYGTVGFDFRSAHDPLVARKAWFFFNEEYVCLGAGISCRNRGMPVVTTLNQCHLRGEVWLGTAGQTKVLLEGEKAYEKADWIFHDQVAYVFPEPTTVKVKNSPASGSWWRINQQSDSPQDELSLDVFKLWLDHGKRPSDASYAYIVVPATSMDQLEQITAQQNISILANTPEVQAVRHDFLQMYQAVFYQAGEIRLNDELMLQCHTPGIVILAILPSGEIKLTVSDPNRELGAMHLSLSVRIENSGENFWVFWNEQRQESKLSIDLPRGQYAGSSVSVVVPYYK